MRKSVDPFGISTLDLLSNALGATILLMLIVAVKSRGNSDIPNDVPPQVGSGKFQTLEIGKEKESKDSNYIIQLKFFNHKEPFNISGYEVFRTDSVDMNDYWLIKVNGSDRKIFTLLANDDDSVQATVFRGGAPVWHNTSKIKKKGNKIIDLDPVSNIIHQ